METRKTGLKVQVKGDAEVAVLDLVGIARSGAVLEEEGSREALSAETVLFGAVLASPFRQCRRTCGFQAGTGATWRHCWSKIS